MTPADGPESLTGRVEMIFSRRQFMEIAALSACAPTLGAMTGSSEEPACIKPPRLKEGDTVGLIAPAFAAFNTLGVDAKIDSLKALGFKVVLGKHFYERHGYFAGSDDARAADVNTLFADPQIKAVIAFAGGWGCARLLPLLDYATIRKNPKILLGLSDVTSLLLGVHAQTGLVTFHGPSPRNRISAEHTMRVLSGDRVTMINPTDVGEDLAETKNRIRVITPGTARGRLVGGNLTVLSAIVGSPYLPDFSDRILFLEDVDEQIYRVDRMLTQLKLAGILDQVAGFVFGKCTECGPGERHGSLTLEQVLDEHIKPLGVPAWQGMMFGHIKEQFTLPEGVEVEIDASAGSIRMLEPAVM